MQPIPRLSVNLPVISVETLVILLVKLTKSRLGGAMGGGLPPLREPLPDCILAPMRNMRNPCPSARIGVDGETYETYETYGDSRREMKRLPLYDFRYSSPTFLGEDSRLLEFY